MLFFSKKILNITFIFLVSINAKGVIDNIFLFLILDLNVIN